ncbi:hypothetical protein [Virgibacillus kimchii]
MSFKSNGSNASNHMDYLLKAKRVLSGEPAKLARDMKEKKNQRLNMKQDYAHSRIEEDEIEKFNALFEERKDSGDAANKEFTQDVEELKRKRMNLRG